MPPPLVGTARRSARAHTAMRPPRFRTAHLDGLRWYVAGQPPPSAAVAAVRDACLNNGGVWHISGHAVDEAVHERLLTASRRFFDQPAAVKSACAVGDMDRSRGWEMYPQHMRYHRATMATADNLPPHPEQSAREGILCERFVCGPPSVCSMSTRTLPPHPFYDSEWGRVFYERNAALSAEHGGEARLLQVEMEAAYPELEQVSRACLQTIAAALGAPHTAFDELVTSDSPVHPDAPLRHHSRLQVNNYPSQLQDRRGIGGARYGVPAVPIRASRHFDTSLLTVLARQPATDLDAVAGSSGALEVWLPEGHRRMEGDGAEADGWTCVPARKGELTVFLGNLAALLTGFQVHGTTHRVSNPCGQVADDARRLSIGFNLKPDYSQPAVPPAALRTALGSLPAVAEADVPVIGLVGRVGWQNHEMQTRGISRLQAVSTFKTWKNETVAKLRDGAYGEACVY